MSWKRPNAKNRMKPLLEILPVSGNFGDIFIDLGTGDGLFSSLLEEKYPGAMVLKSDIRKDIHLENYIVHDLPSFPFRSSSLDGITIAQVLHYFPLKQIESVIIKLLDTLTHEGWILIVEYIIDKPYSWIPFPISLESLTTLCSHLPVPVKTDHTSLADGNRAKYSFLIQKSRTNLTMNPQKKYIKSTQTN